MEDGKKFNNILNPKIWTGMSEWWISVVSDIYCDTNTNLKHPDCLLKLQQKAQHFFFLCFFVTCLPPDFHGNFETYVYVFQLLEKRACKLKGKVTLKIRTLTIQIMYWEESYWNHNLLRWFKQNSTNKFTSLYLIIKILQSLCKGSEHDTRWAGSASVCNPALHIV